MQETPDRSTCGDPVFERSLLTPEALATWEGCSIAWIEALPHTTQADLCVERTGLVMIDCGATQADFRLGRRGMSWEFTSGSIGLFTAGTELRQSRWAWASTRRIHLDLQSVAANLTEPFGQLPRHTELEFRDNELALVLRAMVQEAGAGSPQGKLYAESLSVGVALRLYSRQAHRFAGARERGKLSAPQVRAVEDMVQSRLHANISLEDMARVAGFSAAQFVRLFKNTVGRTPHQYVLRLRLERARTLVLAGELPLYRVAELTGFANQSHMNAAFVRAFNAPPGELRRRAGSKH